MARIYSRKKGKSGSKKPLGKETPKWVEQSTKNVEELVIKLHEKGNSTAVIGTALRDQYGVPDVKTITGKSISKILKEKGVKREKPEDISFLMENAKRLQSHLKKYPKDLSTKRGLEITESKIRRLAKYYKGTRVLPDDWKYKRAK